MKKSREPAFPIGGTPESSRERIMGFTYEVLDPRIGHPKFKEQAQETNAVIFAKGSVLGIEVTVPGLAEQCQLGNVDPQHSEGNADRAAIEVAQTMDIPDGEATFATVRADLDSVGAMALLTLRKQGVELSGATQKRIEKVSESDRFARSDWPGIQPLPTREQLWNESTASAESSEELAAIAAVVADFKLPMSSRVKAMTQWIETGEVPREYQERVNRERLEMVEALEGGEIQIDTVADGKIALVTSAHRAGTSLGYTQAPVVIVLNPSFSFQGSDPIMKFTISQYKAGYVDLPAVFRELNEKEEGWGGSPTIGGSPQGTSSSWTLEEVARVVVSRLVH